MRDDSKSLRRSSSPTIESFLPVNGIQRRRKMRRLLGFALLPMSLILLVLLTVSCWFLFRHLAISNDGEIFIAEAVKPLAKNATFRILLVGDTGGIPIMEVTWAQEVVRNTITKIAEKENIQMVLNMGDNIYFTGPVDEFDNRFQTRFEDVYNTASLDVPWLTIAGNHDHFGNVTAEVEYTKHSKKWFFPSLYYNKTVEWNNTRADFVMIDTISLCGNTRDIQNAGFFQMLANGSHDPRGPLNVTEAEQQWNWIETQLNTSTADYIIVSGHYPIHSMSSHGPTECLRERLDPMLKKYNVNAYFAGHDHTVQHFSYPGNDGHIVHYIVSGAASRADASTKHIKEFSDRNLHYHYPPSSFIPWSPVSQLGFRKGAFANVEFGPEYANFYFYDKKGKFLYHSSFPTRKMPTFQENRSVNKNLDVDI